MAVNQAVIITESSSGKFAQHVMAGKHNFLVDEPIAVGGNDSAPSPYDLILAALGSCTAMTLRMYANFKKIPLETISVKLTHSKIHIEDCADCENKNAKLDHIQREINVKGPLSHEQKQKLLDVANKCPVHQTLTSKIRITTELV